MRLLRQAPMSRERKYVTKITKTRLMTVSITITVISRVFAGLPKQFQFLIKYRGDCHRQGMVVFGQIFTCAWGIKSTRLRAPFVMSECSAKAI